MAREVTGEVSLIKFLPVKHWKLARPPQSWGNAHLGMFQQWPIFPPPLPPIFSYLWMDGRTDRQTKVTCAFQLRLKHASKMWAAASVQYQTHTMAARQRFSSDGGQTRTLGGV